MTGKRSRGMSMPELIVSMVVMGALLVMIGQSAVLITRQQQAVDQRHLALLEISNVMERAFAVPFDALSADVSDAWRLSADCREHLQDAELEREIVASQEDGLAARQIRLTLRWRSRGGGQRRQVQLAAWRYAAGGEDER